MRKSATTTWIILLALVLGLTTSLNAAPSNQPAPCVSAIGQCPPEGCGGDPKLNKLKNVEDAVESPEEWTIDAIVALSSPKKWTTGQNRDSLSNLGEGNGVVVEAFLIHAKQAEPESCNCNLHGQRSTDFHLSLVSDKDMTVDDAVVVEITPHIRPSGWTLKKLQSLAGEKAFVRVTGWLLFDSMHVSSSGGPRATLWENHPVTAFEVCMKTEQSCTAGDGWQALEDF